LIGEIHRFIEGHQVLKTLTYICGVAEFIVRNNWCYQGDEKTDRIDEQIIDEGLESIFDYCKEVIYLLKR
jgi:hypothetical protein